MCEKKSFIKVNLHPKHRVDYNTWIERIMSHIKTGEVAYTRTNTASLYDAMPAFWNNTTIRNRHKILSIIKTATSN